MQINTAPTKLFRAVFAHARTTSENVASACASDDEVEWCECVCYLTTDRRSGYAVKDNEELVCLFSTIPKRGARLVQHAITQGARRLDCFDGYLPTLYLRYGFEEERREANWNDTGPDVVYMRIPQGAA